MRRIFLGLTVLAMLATGCTTMATYQAEQAKWQALADQATAHFGAGTVTVLVSQKAGYGGEYQRFTRTITLVPYPEARMRLTLAHELGHHILNHADMRLDQEKAANLFAIRVLVEAWGMDEEAAMRAMGNKLLGSAQGAFLVPGHDYCAEFADLRAHYPQYAPRDPAKVNAICPGAGWTTMRPA